MIWRLGAVAHACNPSTLGVRENKSERKETQEGGSFIPVPTFPDATKLFLPSPPETMFSHASQAGLELLGSSDPPSLASQSCYDDGHEPPCLANQHRVPLAFRRKWDTGDGGGRWVDHLRPGVRDQPGQHEETPSLLKIQKISQVWWWVPVIPATWEAGAGESLESGRWRLQ
ncbi:hypothetical protein AAY473_027491 [Plecturocebus cupreus]